MSYTPIPSAPADVLSIPKSDIPIAVRTLISQRRLSSLMAQIHSEMNSADPALQHQSRAALERLGFTE